MDKYKACEICPHNSLLLTVNNDCKLQFWKTEDNSLQQEYHLPSHLASNISTIKWAYPLKKTLRSNKRLNSYDETDLVAIGMENGSIYLYSLSHGEIIKLSSEHNEAINALIWDLTNANIYSCSNDKYISIFSSEGTCLKKWLADDNAIFSIQLCEDSNFLLSANRNIKLWNIKTQEIMKTFFGHIEPISSIILMDSSCYKENDKVTPVKKKLRSRGKEPENNSTDANSNLENLYFFTSSILERDIKMWCLNKSNDKKTTPEILYTAETDVRLFDVLTSHDNKGINYVATVTKSGKLQIFSSDAFIKLAKPIHPLTTVVYRLKNADDNAPNIPIICAKFVSCDNLKTQPDQITNQSLQHNVTLNVCFLKPGTNQPQFQILIVNDLKLGENVIYKDFDPPQGSDGTPSDSQIKTIVDPKATMTLDSRVRELLANRSSKKRRNEAKTPVLPLQPESAKPQANYVPKADSLVALITQSLQAGDRGKLWGVLQANNETVIRETVKRLPVKWICPFVSELGNRMTFAKINELKPTLTWFDNVLLHHASYLISTPQIYRDLLAVQELMLDRTSVFPKLMQLKGKLGHLVHQAQLRKQHETSGKSALVEDTSDPALIYYEESDTEPDEGVGSELMV